jgi:hypothetical protein
MNDDSTSKKRDRLEAMIAILLGIAAVFVAVAGYQSALRNGDSIDSFNQGIRSINDANTFFNQAVQKQTTDQALFLEYAKATQDGNDTLRTYLRRNIMDPNLRAGLREWENDATDKVLSPLTADAYQIPEQAEGERLEKLTNRQFETARALDNKGDRFDLVGVIVASSLFFLGIAGVMRNMRTKIVGVSLGAATLIAGFAMWLTI